MLLKYGLKFSLKNVHDFDNVQGWWIRMETDVDIGFDGAYIQSQAQQ